MTRHGTARPSLTAGRWAKICKQATQSQIASDSSPGRHASANWRNILLQPPPFRTLSTRQGAHQRASTVTGVCLALASRGLRSVQQSAQRNQHLAGLHTGTPAAFMASVSSRVRSARAGFPARRALISIGLTLNRSARVRTS